jgi:hypothetical protein
MDPTASASCGAARELRVGFGSVGLGGSAVLPPAAGSFFTNVRDVYSLTVNGTGERRFRLLLRGSTSCDYLRYEDPAGSDGRPGTSDDVVFGGVTGRSVLVTRLDDVNGKRAWRAQSQQVTGGAHVAFCEKVTKRGSVYAGAYDVPFDVTVYEK